MTLSRPNIVSSPTVKDKPEPSPSVTAPAPRSLKGRKDPAAGEEKEFEIARGARMRFCWVPAGSAILGSPATEIGRVPNEAEHEYESGGFWLGKYEVRQSEYESVMGANPSKFKGARLPVEGLSFDDCQAFVAKCKVLDFTPRLPHEDEWEYACRGGAGNKRPFPWGVALNANQANCDGTKPYGTEKIGPFLSKTTEAGHYEREYPHAWGLCDMCGNVWEWCQTSGPRRAIRGGCWIDPPQSCRAATRAEHDPSAKLAGVGFRLVLVPKNQNATSDKIRMNGVPSPESPVGTSPIGDSKESSDRAGHSDQVEKVVAQAKLKYQDEAKAAAHALLDNFDEIRQNLVASKKLTDTAKLAQLEALAKDRAAFENAHVRPNNSAMQSALKRYDIAIAKAREDFSKAIDSASQIYVESKDTSKYESLLREKLQFLGQNRK